MYSSIKSSFWTKGDLLGAFLLNWSGFPLTCSKVGGSCNYFIAHECISGDGPARATSRRLAGDCTGLHCTGLDRQKWRSLVPEAKTHSRFPEYCSIMYQQISTLSVGRQRLTLFSLTTEVLFYLSYPFTTATNPRPDLGSLQV